MSEPLLAMATVMYLGSMLWVVRQLRLRRGHAAAGFWGMVGAFLLHTLALLQFTAGLGHVPLTTLRELLLLTGWATALLFLLLQPTLKMPLLGVFAVPLIFLLSVLSLVTPPPSGQRPELPVSPLLKLHVPFLVVAYVAFGVSCVVGIMYLLQERELKSHRPRPVFHLLPALELMERLHFGLVLAGFALLTVGLIGGVALYHQLHGSWLVPDIKFTLSLLVWFGYGAMLVARAGLALRGRRVVWMGTATFMLLLVTFWAANLWSSAHRY